jgi:hypothetical protein
MVTRTPLDDGSGAPADNRGPETSVPAIIRALYDGRALYPAEDPAVADRLLEELARDLAPADFTQWLVTTEIWAVLLDEAQYRKMLTKLMSAKELKPTDLPTQAEEDHKLVAEAQSAGIRRGLLKQGQNDEERKAALAKLYEEFADKHLTKKAAEKANAPELERRAAVSNFQKYSREIEMLSILIERCSKKKKDLIVRLEAMKASATIRAKFAAEIEDVEYAEAAE